MSTRRSREPETPAWFSDRRFKKADLRRGIAPVAVVALDKAGQEIDRQPTGFAG